MIGIGPGPAVAGEQVAPLGVRQHPVVKRTVTLRLDRLVGLAPVDLALGLAIHDEELVVGRAAGVDAGVHHQRAAVRDPTFATANGFLVERRNR
jgi:hypothetical protein